MFRIFIFRLAFVWNRTQFNAEDVSVSYGLGNILLILNPVFGKCLQNHCLRDSVTILCFFFGWVFLETGLW